MGSKFLSGGTDEVSLAVLTDGTFDANLKSLKIQDGTPGSTVRLNGDKLLVSSLIETTDLNFGIIENPLTSNLDLAGNDIVDVDKLSVFEIGERSIGVGVNVTDPLFTNDISITSGNQLKTDNISENTPANGIDVLNDIHMNSKTIDGVFQLKTDEIGESTLTAGVSMLNTLYTQEVIVTGSNTIKTDKIQEATQDDGINILSTLHINDGVIDQVTELKCDSIDSRGGLISVSFPSNLNTPDVICDVLREKTLLGGVTCKNNLNMFGKNINNALGLYIDNIYERTGLLGINIRNDTNFNSKNVSGISTLSASTLTATITKTINLQNPTPASAIFVASPLTLDTVAISGVSQITATTLDTDTINPISGTDVLVNANLDMTAKNIENCNEVKTDNLTSSTTDKIIINNDLDFQNTYNLLNIDSINNIRPSGGLYSQSNLTQFNQTVETNMLGGANTSGSLSIPANTFKQLAVYSFKSSGILAGGSNDLFTLRLKSSTGALFAVLPVTITDNGLTNVWWDLSADFSINTIGAAGVAVIVSTVVFRYINNTNVVATRAVSNINNTTFDTTILNTLEFTFQNDVTNPLTFLQMNAASFTQWY